ncbi:MAG TPA: outer membrane lipoprotein carrier protein LolA [Verrucomicrobiae bacterium]|jgi:outer membrane lipoprotein carrier protein|nr:outer membrane lipoprotein carrier protein LolA [Verrucomicrobiae bacterium]
MTRRKFLEKMLKSILSVIVIGLVAAGSVHAGTMASAGAPVSKDLKQVLDRLQRHYHDTNSFTAKFNEEIATVGAPKKNRTGTVSFRKPGRMRWEFDDPEKQTIVSDGETLYSYDPDLNQVVETPLKQALKSSSATSFLLGIGNINRDFKAAFAHPATPTGLVDLVLDAKSGGYVIQVGLDPKGYNLMTLTLTDQLGDVTRIDFSDIHDNVELSDSTFAFKTPAGADVVTAPASP